MRTLTLVLKSIGVIILILALSHLLFSTPECDGTFHNTVIKKNRGEISKIDVKFMEFDNVAKEIEVNDKVVIDQILSCLEIEYIAKPSIALCIPSHHIVIYYRNQPYTVSYHNDHGIYPLRNPSGDKSRFNTLSKGKLSSLNQLLKSLQNVNVNNG